MNASTPMMNATMKPSWASHPRPREGELLESWIVRLAEVQVEPNHWLLEELELDGHIGALSRISLDAFESLSRVTGVEIARILALHLSSFGETTGAVCTVPYIIPARTKAAEGVHFKPCPVCLESDEVPYLRLSWALDITCFCPVHRSVLLENCQKCGVQFRLNTGQRKARLHECVNCGFDVRASAVISSDQFATVIAFQQHLLALRHDDTARFIGKRAVSSSSFAALVQRLFRRLQDLGFCVALESLNDSSFQETVLLLDDRFLARDKRANALSMIAWLMDDPLPRWRSLEPQLRRHPSSVVGTRMHSAFRTAIQSLGIAADNVREVRL